MLSLHDNKNIHQQKDVQKNRLLGEAFHIKLWRKITEETCHSIDFKASGLQIITPWGFELLGDKIFLTKKLRRFYCYLGMPHHHHHHDDKNDDQEKITRRFRDALVEKIKMFDPQMFKDIVIIVENSNLIKLQPDDYICLPTDKMLDIQFRYVKKDILTDYADYLIMALEGIYSEKGESKDINHNKVCRWRTYQLYIMEETLFDGLLPPMSVAERKIFYSLFALMENMIQVFYTRGMIYDTPSEQETHAMNFLIKKRMLLMREIISQKNDSEMLHMHCKSFHGEEMLEININKKIHEYLSNKIKKSYLMYGQ